MCLAKESRRCTFAHPILPDNFRSLDRTCSSDPPGEKDLWPYPYRLFTALWHESFLNGYTHSLIHPISSGCDAQRDSAIYACWCWVTAMTDSEIMGEPNASLLALKMCCSSGTSDPPADSGSIPEQHCGAFAHSSKSTNFSTNCLIEAVCLLWAVEALSGSWGAFFSFLRGYLQLSPYMLLQNVFYNHLSWKQNVNKRQT